MPACIRLSKSQYRQVVRKAVPPIAKNNKVDLELAFSSHPISSTAVMASIISWKKEWNQGTFF
jgi:hypothetical protein